MSHARSLCIFMNICRNFLLRPEYPSIWETIRSGKAESMVEVQKGTQEYTNAVKEFEESLAKHKGNFSIEKVQRIENRIEYGRHTAVYRSIREKHKKEPLVKRLFHGSKQKSLELIAVRGFNRNFAADANGINCIHAYKYLTIY